MGNLVQFFVIIASIVTSFISFSTSPVRDSLLSGDPFLSFQAKAQQDGDSLSEPEDSEGIDDHVADNENGPSLPLISSSFVMTPNTLQLIALDGDTPQYVTVPSVKMSVLDNSYKTVLGEVFQGINPFTGKKVTVDNIKALHLLNESNQTVSLGYGTVLTILG